MSQRSGTDEIWICDSDGSKAAQLTSLGGAAIYGPNWSPDSRTIAFTAAQKGMKEDIYSISANGGTPRRLTSHPAEDKWAYWSHDGKWIYFSSTRSGREEIWKMSSSGGEAVQITRNSGDTPQESPDGKFLYYMKGWPETGEPRWMEIKKRKFLTLYIPRADLAFGKRGFTSSNPRQNRTQ